jgi:hypothetical protein
VLASAVSVDTWHHIAGQEISSGSRKVWVDGSSGSNTNNLSPSGINANYIGVRPNLSTDFNGRIAEVALWNEELDADEIAALARGASVRRIRPLALVAYWPLWGIGSSEIDCSPGGNSMSITGSLSRANHAPVRPFSIWVPTYLEVAGAVDREFAASATMTADLTAVLAPDRKLVASATMTADLTAVTDVNRNCVASATMTADVVAVTQVDRNCVASAAMTADLAATLTREVTFAAAMTATADVGASLTREVPLVASATMTADVGAVLAPDRTLVASATMSVDVVAAVTREVTFAASATMTSDVAAVLTREAALVASATMAADMGAVLSVQGQVTFAAAMTATADITAGMTLEVSLASSMTATVDLSAYLGCALAASMTASANFASNLWSDHGIELSIAVRQSPSKAVPEQVQVDMVGTWSGRSSFPFHELRYKTTIIGYAGGNYSTDSKPINVGYGPIAAFVIETAGTYTIRVECWEFDDSGNLVDYVSDTSNSITVDSKTTEWPSATKRILYAADNDFTGAPTSSQEKYYNPGTNYDWTDVIGDLNAGYRVSLKKGNTFSIATTIPLGSSTSASLLDTWGSGADPVLSATTEIFKANHGTEDVRVEEMDFDGNNGSGSFFKTHTVLANPALAYFTVSRCRIQHPDICCNIDISDDGGADKEIPKGVFFFETEMSNMDGGSNFFWGVAKESAILGCYIHDVDTGEHCVRNQMAQKFVLTHNKIYYPSHASAAGKNAWDLRCFATDKSWDNITDPIETKYVVFSDNDVMMHYEGGGCIRWISEGDPEKETPISQVIVERNLIRVDDAATMTALLFTAIQVYGQYLTIRNNKIIGARDATNNYRAHTMVNLSDQGQNLHGTPTSHVWVYNNSGYAALDESTNDFIGVKFTRNGERGGMDSLYIHNNIWYCPNLTGICTEISYDALPPNYDASNNTTDGVSTPVPGQSTPGWVDNDPTTAAHMELASGSGAIGQGKGLSYLWEDYEQRWRPQNTTYDMGAGERDNSEPWPGRNFIASMTATCDMGAVLDVTSPVVTFAAAMTATCDMVSAASVDRTLVASATMTSDMVAVLTTGAEKAFAAALTATSDLAGALTREVTLAALVEATADVLAEASVDRTLSVAVQADANLVGVASVDRSVIASLQATADLSAALNIEGETTFAAALTATADVAGALGVDRNMVGALQADANLVGVLVREVPYVVALQSDGNLVAVLSRDANLAASLLSTADLTATLSIGAIDTIVEGECVFHLTVEDESVFHQTVEGEAVF